MLIIKKWCLWSYHMKYLILFYNNKCNLILNFVLELNIFEFLVHVFFSPPAFITRRPTRMENMMFVNSVWHTSDNKKYVVWQGLVGRLDRKWGFVLHWVLVPEVSSVKTFGMTIWWLQNCALRWSVHVCEMCYLPLHIPGCWMWSVQWLALLLCMYDVLDPNPSPSPFQSAFSWWGHSLPSRTGFVTSFLCFSQYPGWLGYCFKLGCDSFLPHSFQFIID